MNENKILAAVAESLSKTHDAINQANTALGTLAREYLYRSMLESALSGELIAMEAALKSVQERIQRQEKHEAMLAEMDPQNREAFNALYEENRARYARLLNEKHPGK